ncbi:sensor histidine kinase [Kocuria flava]|uniref:sensor histidine kinase n=1 Tax=Kocuria flava TaxID=446860 RepID=UPI0011BDFC36|nr:PAS domain-containing sensor histidine kinase [Kocuria flava]
MHELSPRARVVISQLPQTLATVVLLIAVGLFRPGLLADARVLWGGGLTVALLLACVLVPWEALGPKASLVIPVLDFLPVGLLFEGMFPHVLGIPFLVTLPMLWLVASGQLGRLGAPIGALLTLAMLWAPVLLGPEPVSVAALSESVLIPVMVLAIGAMAQVLVDSAGAKDARLRQLLAEAARRERLLHTVLESVDVWVLALDETGRPVLANNDQLAAYAHRRHGHQQAPLDLYDRAGERVPAAEAPIARAVAGESFSGELLRVGEPAAQRILSATARVLHDDQGQPEGSVLSFSDVTELVEALEAKDEFVAGISHELRTPLTSIRGYTELLSLDEQLSEPAQAGLAVIERNAEQLLHLVEDLLSTHRGPARRHSGPVDLLPVLEQALEAARPGAERAEVALTMWAHPSLVVLGDPVGLRQVLDNLISNAVKYSPPHRPVFVIATTETTTAQVQVIDHGYGMSPHEVARVFEKYYRSPTARMSTTPGLGIGLALSKAIVEDHGGTLTCHSTAGEGTIFTLTLPTA